MVIELTKYNLPVKPEEYERLLKFAPMPVAGLLNEAAIPTKDEKDKTTKDRKKQPWEYTKEEFGYGDKTDWPLKVSFKGQIYGEPALKVWYSQNIGKAPHFGNPKSAQKWVDDTHKRIIQDAINHNIPVPTEVLRDYPELIKRNEPENTQNDSHGNINISEIEKAHAARTERARIQDERRPNAITISTRDKKVKGWMNDPGSADVSGIDTKNKVIYKQGPITITESTKDQPGSTGRVTFTEKPEKIRYNINVHRKRSPEIDIGAGVVRQGRRQYIRLG
jgi:hypothetical protein